jgi:hypothetical protein
VIGLLVTGVLALTSAGLLVTAAGLALGRAGAFETGLGPDAEHASARVLDVDDWGDPEFGYDYMVDVQFSTPTGTEVVSVDGPDDRPTPLVGHVVDVAYDPSDPEWAEVASEADGRIGSPGAAGAADSGEGTDPGVVAAWGGGFGALALAALASTVVWARRAPKPERPGPFASWGYPPAYGYPPPAYGYPPPAYGYPPPAYGYPPPAYGYPPSHQPPPQPATPAQPPAAPTQPLAPPPGGWPTPR